MPIRIPNELPAVKTLTEENIFVMTETRARTQDIRPLQIAAAEPDAHQDRHRDPAEPGCCPTPPFRWSWSWSAPPRPRAEEHPPGAHAGLLQALRRRQGPKLRRHGHHRRAGGAPALRGGGVLAGAVPHHGVDQDPRPLHLPHLLGGPGGALLPLRHPQGAPARRSSSACSPTSWSGGATCSSGAATTCSWCPTPATPPSAGRTWRRCRR